MEIGTSAATNSFRSVTVWDRTGAGTATAGVAARCTVAHAPSTDGAEHCRRRDRNTCHRERSSSCRSPTANRRPRSMRSRTRRLSRATRLDGLRRPSDARDPRSAVPHRCARRPPAPRVVLPVPCDPEPLRHRAHRVGAGALLRGVPVDADAHRRSRRAGGGLATRPPRVLLARRLGRLHGEFHRSRPLLPRGHRGHAADVRPQPDPSCRRWSVGAAAIGRWSR